jgi:UDP-glucose 4-epimerase
MKILVTGGAGYIGSHTVVELLNEGHDVTVVDNLCNSSRESLRRVEQITGKTVDFHEMDVRDAAGLDRLFSEQPFDAVMHFAGLKAVGESVAKPLEYYRTNIDATLTLCDVMQRHGVHQLIFSSTATVYGVPESLPLTTDSRVGVGLSNPYGKSKYMQEEILRDLPVADDRWQITLLRYFNPIGAHASGLIGEDPIGIPNNLLPYIMKVAVGALPELTVHGNDYDTPDGTGVRDYIHITDLARGHLAALHRMPAPGQVQAYNLSTGHGTSVLEMIKTVEAVCGKPIPYRIAGRRPGDLASVYADAALTTQELGWQAELSVEDGCRSSWQWQSRNPRGFNG